MRDLEATRKPGAISSLPGWACVPYLLQERDKAERRVVPDACRCLDRGRAERPSKGVEADASKEENVVYWKRGEGSRSAVWMLPASLSILLLQI
jgi:hypothetical protein